MEKLVNLQQCQYHNVYIYIDQLQIPGVSEASESIIFSFFWGHTQLFCSFCVQRGDSGEVEQERKEKHRIEETK